MAKWKKILLFTLGALALLALFSATLLPVLIRNQAVKALAAATGRTVRIEKVSINPLTLRATVRGLAIEEQGGGPFFSLGALTVSVSPTSIYRRALVLSEVSLESPSLRVVRAGADRFNYTDILERQEKKEEKPKPAAGIFPFVLNNVRLTGGSLEVEDRAVAGGRTHSLRNLEIDLPWLSSLPAEADHEAELRISLVVNGAPLSLTGKVRPFGGDLAGSLRLILQKLSLPPLAVYAPQAPPVELAAGELTLDLDLRFRRPAGGPPDLHVMGLARLDTLELKLATGEPLLKLPLLEVRTAALEPLAGRFAIESVALEGPELFVSRNRQGEWMFKPLLAAGPPSPAKADAPAGKPDQDGQGNPTGTGQAEKAAALVPPDPGQSAAPPFFSVASLKLQGGRIHFRDEAPREGFRAEAEAIALAVENLTNRPGEKGQYDLSLRVDGETGLASRGSFSLGEPAVQADLRLTGLPLQKGWPYLAAYLTAPVRGVADLSGEVAFSAKGGLIAEKGRLALRDLAVRYGDGEGLDLKSLLIDGAAFHWQANRLTIDRIKLAEGQVTLSRGADGRLSPLALLVAQEKAAGADQGRAAAPGASGAAGQQAPAAVETAAAPSVPHAAASEEAVKPLAYHLKQFDLERFAVAFTDRSRPESPRFTLGDTTLSLADLGGPEPRPARFRFASTFGKEASLQAAGDLTPAPFSYRGNLKVGRLPIRDFESYYAGNLNFQVLGGLLDATLALDVALADGVATGDFRGDAGLSDFHAVDGVEREDLLKWRRLQLEKIDGALGPFRLAIDLVSLNEVYARIIIREDGTVNLQNLLRKEGGGAGTAAGGVEAPPQIRIGAVTLLKGTVAFTDKHLPDDFETTFYNLGGRISGLSSAASLLADVDLRGNLENHSPLRIAGKINPLREDLFVDLKLTFSDIELSPLSTYSETYLGYILKQGKLFLDMEYHIENKQLSSSNKIRVDQFTFGDEVASDKATSLPVKLGLALLKDRNGEIHLDVPVMGRIDDPQFNIWQIVFQVIKNLLVKAVTAPFALLSSLVAGDTDLSVVAFAPGSGALAPVEEKKLDALAQGLLDRPALKLALTGYVDREKDAEGYRSELLERRLKREKFLALAREKWNAVGQTADSVTLTDAERSTYLKSLYARQTFPKPRDAKGAELSLAAPEMAKLILANIQVDRDELEDLARERTEAVKRHLVEQEKIPAERIFQQKADIFRPPAKEETPRSRVELNALAP